MKIAILAIGESRQTAAPFGERIYETIPCFIPRTDNDGINVSVISTDIASVDLALKKGVAPLPELFVQADRRMIVSADDAASRYLDALGEALTQAYKRYQVSAEQIPQILQMNQAIARRCLRLNLTTVTFLAAGPSSESALAERISKRPGFSVHTMERHASMQLQNKLFEAAVDVAVNAGRRGLTREFRKMLNALVGKMAQVVVIDGDVAGDVVPEINADNELPVVLDAQDVYVQAISDWALTYRASNTPPRCYFSNTQSLQWLTGGFFMGWVC